VGGRAVMVKEEESNAMGMGGRRYELILGMLVVL